MSIFKKNGGIEFSGGSSKLGGNYDESFLRFKASEANYRAGKTFLSEL